MSVVDFIVIVMFSSRPYSRSFILLESFNMDDDSQGELKNISRKYVLHNMIYHVNQFWWKIYFLWSWNEKV